MYIYWLYIDFSVMDSDDVEKKVLKQLQAAFELPTVKGYVRQVVVITDGLVR